METGPRLKVSSDRLMKPVIEPATPGLQGKRFIHNTTAAPSGWIKTSIHIWASMRENLSSGFMNSTGADQPAHPRSLISTFVIRF